MQLIVSTTLNSRCLQLKILLDMNLSTEWVQFLANHGFDSVHWSEIGRASAPDTTIMEYAGQHGFVISTHDLGFAALLATRKTRQPSVIQVRTQDILPAAIGNLVVKTLTTCGNQLETGALVTIDPRRQRVRLLPI
jgi:predicted nuclease of predicted toxin-antitoxin system